jgi:hypothetical protein
MQPLNKVHIIILPKRDAYSAHDTLLFISFTLVTGMV